MVHDGQNSHASLALGQTAGRAELTAETLQCPTSWLPLGFMQAGKGEIAAFARPPDPRRANCDSDMTDLGQKVRRSSVP
jgi:hypothetical protein